jgi:hypothetical protein
VEKMMIHFLRPQPVRGFASCRNAASDKRNQDHQLSWWYALRLEGDSTGGPTRALNGLPIAFPSRAAAKAAHVFVFIKMNLFEV